MRARLALAISRTLCELREVKLAAKPQEMLAASPKGTVPVLVLPGGAVIDESLEIMRWSLAGNDPEGWLGRDDPELIRANDGGFKHHLDRYKYPERHGTDPIEHRDAGLTFLRQLEERLTCAGQLCGSQRGLADAAIMPFVRQFAAVDRVWFEARPLPRLHVWLAEHMASRLFDTIMMRIPAWAPGEPAVALAHEESSGSVDEGS